MIEIVINSKATTQSKHIDEVEMALKELKKQVKKSGLMQELRRREHYVSPSKAKVLKRAESIKQRKREERKQEWNKQNTTEY